MIIVKKDGGWDGQPRLGVDASPEGIELPSHSTCFPHALVFALACLGEEFGGGLGERTAGYAPMQGATPNSAVFPEFGRVAGNID